MISLLNDAVNTGISIVATVQSNKLKGFDDISKFFKGAIHGAVLGNQGTTTIFQVSSAKELPTFTFALLFQNGLYRKVKIPKFVK